MLYSKAGPSSGGGALKSSTRQSREWGGAWEAGPRATPQGRAVGGVEPGRRGFELLLSLSGRRAELWRRGLEMPHNKAEPWAGRNSG